MKSMIYEKDELNKHLEEIRLFNKKRLLTLKMERNNLLEEKEDLERYLDKITIELGSLPSFRILELGLSRLEKVCTFLNQAADDNAKQIMENARREIADFQGQIKETENKIEKARSGIQSIVSKMLEGVNSQNEDIVNGQRTGSKVEYHQEDQENKEVEEDELGIEALNALASTDDSGNEALQSDQENTKNNKKFYEYMVGKLAGEDLADNSGKIIIKAKEAITLEHIETASKKGKVSELIIGMDLPENSNIH